MLYVEPGLKARLVSALETLLKLKYDELLSNFTFDFNVLRPYTTAISREWAPDRGGFGPFEVAVVSLLVLNFMWFKFAVIWWGEGGGTI